MEIEIFTLQGPFQNNCYLEMLNFMLVSYFSFYIYIYTSMYTSLKQYNLFFTMVKF